MTIWVAAWQMQCCGEPFHVGSQVAWTLGARNVLRALTTLGAMVAAICVAAYVNRQRDRRRRSTS